MKPSTHSDRHVWLESPEHLGRIRLLVPEGEAPAVRDAYAEVTSADELLAHLERRVSVPTLRAIADRLGGGVDLRPPTPVLAQMARRGEARLLLTFAGQAQTYVDDLAALYAEDQLARAVIEACADALTDELAQGADLHGLHPYGVDLRSWLRDPETRPPAEATSGLALSLPLIFVCQAARLATLARYGLDPEAIGEWCIATSGHSQGMLAAMLAAEGRSVEALPLRAAAYARFALWEAIRMQTSYGRSGRGETPMVAVTGLALEEVQAALDPEATIALINATRRFVLSGPPDALERTTRRLERLAEAALSAHAGGQIELPRTPALEWLEVSAPFHSPAMADAVEPLRDEARRLGLAPDRFAVPVLSDEDGKVWSATDDLAANQCTRPVDWPATLSAALRLDVTHVLDLGPGAGVAALNGLCTRGFGVASIAAATPAGIAMLRSLDHSDVEPPATWSSFEPIAVRTPDGETRLENAFTRATGRPPILLPGMTPTTVEAPIVSAAANAGYVAELAGGGQPTEAVLRRRCDELRDALAPGEGYVFNTLYLDPHLWGLHIGRDRLVQRLRAEGHPILGVTVSAGLPPVEEAVSLLREWRGLGMHLNAFKVGTDEQFRRVLAIAAAADDGPVYLHVEGGRAGGHHNFSGLDEMLLRWYARIRRYSNVVLCVGGGISTPERAEALLTGHWSRPYGVAPMPVDAIFVGTAAMAAAEARTSPVVKEALVRARGANDQIPRGGERGGVLSTRSGLGADIYYLSNHAGRTAQLLDTLAGDTEAVAARKTELVDALSRTAKPYFGDVESMTYQALLERLLELMAIGQDGPYEDAIWLDATHRRRFGALLRRALRRCDYGEALPEDDRLDRRDLLAHIDCPALAATPVLPEDARYFASVCGWPGKPVPFVPVIDANIHRWYSRDSLWQSHDDRYDAEAVLVIPGPAVEGIRDTDEPVADLLARFVSTTRAGADIVERPAPDLLEVATSAEVCMVGTRECPNPLPAMLAHGAKLHATGARRARLTLRHALPEGEAKLTLDFDVRPGHPVPLRAASDHASRLRAFYRGLMPGGLALDADRVAGYRRITLDDGPQAPLQLLFAAAMPAMMRALLDDDVGGDPLSLLHHGGEVEHVRALRPAPFEVEVDPPHVEDTRGGRLIAVAARIVQDGTLTARLVQRFLIRATDRIFQAKSGPAPASLMPAYVALERPRPLVDATLDAPRDLTPFAAVSGDLNPIHRDPALAALAGLDSGPIVHGQWTAAATCGLLAERGLRAASVRFLAPVEPGARLHVTAHVVGRRAGDEVVSAEVRSGDIAVLALTAIRPSVATAIVFPGQGCQRRGMGMDAFARSKAAREVWQRADAHTRSKYGFSLVEVVRENPTELDVAGELLRNPQGVLNVTQITQVALTVLAVAGVAELEEAGTLPPGAMFCGHSVGEYSALSAMTYVLPLEALVDVVYQRGRTMQNFVPRDAEGRSPYGMGVIRPHKAGMDGLRATTLVQLVAHRTGQPLYVVNHNVRDRQYAVAGHVEAIAELKAALPDPEGWVDLPGIDVPFHSPLLSNGVAAFRDVLQRCIPHDIATDALVGRYIPNLVARPFDLGPDFVAAIVDATGTTHLDGAPTGRAILIELLAWQFASPVQWIDTQTLLAERADRMVEVGPGAAPVLVNMMRSSLRGSDAQLELLHAERDRDAVLGLGPEIVEAPPELEVSTPADVPVVAAAPAAAPAPSTAEDAPYGVAEALFALLARSTGRPEIAQTESLDDLLGGNSAKRNQVLLDIGKEFGVGPVDGAHTMPLAQLAETLDRDVSRRYRHPGPYLRAAQDEALAQAGLTRKAAGTLLTSRGVPPGTQAALLTRLAVEGGDLEAMAPPPVAAAQGAQAAVMVDPEAEKARWRPLARAALQAAGIDPTLVDRAAQAPREAARPRQTEQTGRFEPGRHVAFTAAAAWARSDALWAFGEHLAGHAVGLERLVACRTPALDLTLGFLAERAARMGRDEVAAAFRAVLDAEVPAQLWTDETALITGAGPGSIAEALVRQLLAGGARVVVTTSRLGRERVARYKALYRENATPGAELHVVPFDQGSREDVDALCRWVYRSGYEVRGPKRVRVKGPWVPTLCFPFGAAPAEGDPTEIGDDIAQTLVVNLVGVERLVGGLAREAAASATPPVHVVLPLSPNHGQMGRDGLYAEAKAGLEALLLRWRAEHERWGRHTTLVGARIGWVRGTGLMAALDRVYEQVEQELGIQTFSPAEMASLLLDWCDAPHRERAATEPLVADFTAGFGAATGLRELIERALSTARDEQGEGVETATPLPYERFAFPVLPSADANRTAIDPAKTVAIVGFAEVGPFGNERVRWAMERDGALSTEAALELAWLCGCVRFEGATWVDVESGEPVDPAAVYDRYSLGERIGVRGLETFDPSRVEVLTEVTLAEDLVFTVSDEAKAQSFVALDPERTEYFPDGDGGFRVVRRAGSKVRVPRAVAFERDIAGQLPEGWDPTRLGIDEGLSGEIDPTAVFNLLATSEAFRAAGLAPEELWSVVHPGRIGCTQGSGIGGMRALRRLYIDPVLDKPRQTDVLQETLINVAAAWPAMSFYGSYGPMVHPVGACATAAVSIEVGADLITAGKADFVVAGAYDDIGREGVRGFGDMNATIDAATIDQRGFDPDQASRPCDARRGGFVEAQGGGTLLLCRGDIAVELGLPIYGLVAGAWSAGDGIQRSVPAPGPGLLRIGAGGTDSPLGRALGALGLDADDVGVVSLHGTSTEANDLNETRLHADLAIAIGRTEGNPLPVIAQKALTGHAKGGAAAWQTCGLLQSLTDGVVPPMRNLDEPDPALAERAPLVFPDRAVRGGLRAGLLTSLGFGHVGAAVLLAHPDVLLETLEGPDLAAYAEARAVRWRARFAEQHAVLLGEQPLFEMRTDKPVEGDAERALLLDPDARLSC